MTEDHDERTDGSDPADRTTETEGESAARAAAERAAAAASATDASVGATGGLSLDEPEPARAELPDAETLESAMAGAAGTDADGASGSDAETGPGTPAAAPGVETETTREETTRVLEFALGEELYCLDIEYVEEIVKRDTITRVPNTPDYVEGVVDLRGQITTILDPKALLSIDDAGPERLIVVFDPAAFEEQGAVGWLVDEVRQVEPVPESEVNDPPVDEEYVNGVVDRDDGSAFVIWTDPGVAMELATDDD